ncbi:hypothetical protein [Arthrobacter sp. ES1]|uniref:hypothetical protein n=1 Tax=Arthrobacter sp. ES1 TaxID=1897056 RepID=UPI001CFFC187|nr:hypothetical protein [Arthrobacter sp. ES1]MCB5280323.1 hypothetical protein [Arthrobacter sp. ES1]
MAASQGRVAARAAEETVRPQPQRFRVNVPAADEAVLAWMALQDNHSLSVRMLIRESIERNGYIDVVNKPVDQLPKRGRPTVSEDEQPDAAPAGQATQAPPSAPPVLHLLPPAAEAPVSPAASADLDLTPEQSSAPELLGIALESPVLVPTAPQPAAPAVSIPAPPAPEQPSSGQLDVNDIFTSIR